MKTSGSEALTELLRRWSQGDQQASAEAMTLAYPELLRLARRFFRHERSGHTLEASAVVHEAFSRLVDQDGLRFCNRAHFFGLFARVMRRVLVDYARDRNTGKRGGRRERVTIVESTALALERTPDLLALHEALDRLQALDPQKAEIVELRFFGGCSIDETAQSLGLSAATVSRQWRRARAWLFRELSPPGAALPPESTHAP